MFCCCIPKKKNKGGLGSLYRHTEESLEEVIEKIVNTPESILDIMAKNCYDYATKNQNIFLDKVMNLFNDVFEQTKKIKFNIKEYSDNDLPSISIITPVRNLPDIFKISVLNYTSTSYPKEKIEWIIVDDSDEDKTVETLLPLKENREKI